MIIQYASFQVEFGKYIIDNEHEYIKKITNSATNFLSHFSLLYIS
jgi:hypothetical protein